MKRYVALIAILVVNSGGWYCTFEEDFSIKARIFMIIFVYIITLLGVILIAEK